MVASVLVVMIAAGIAWFVARDDGPNLVTGVETAATSGQESEAGPSQEAEDPSKSASPESEKQAEQQAKVLDALLTDSRGSRSGLGPALNQLRSCTDTAPALETVRRVTDARREQVVQVKALDTGAFDEGRRRHGQEPPNGGSDRLVQRRRGVSHLGDSPGRRLRQGMER